MKPRALLLHGGPGVPDYLEGIGHFPWLEQPGIIRDQAVDFLASRSS